MTAPCPTPAPELPRPANVARFCCACGRWLTAWVPSDRIQCPCRRRWAGADGWRRVVLVRDLPAPEVTEPQSPPRGVRR